MGFCTVETQPNPNSKAEVVSPDAGRTQEQPEMRMQGQVGPVRRVRCAACVRGCAVHQLRSAMGGLVPSAAPQLSLCVLGSVALAARLPIQLGPRLGLNIKNSTIVR